MFHSHLVRFRVVPWNWTTDADLSTLPENLPAELAERVGCDPGDIEILETVSPEERLNRLVSDNLPPSIAGWLAGYAYEQGHAYGEDEVNSILFNMAHGLIDALKKPGTLEWLASRLK
jgi:hypothetical protein